MRAWRGWMAAAVLLVAAGAASAEEPARGEASFELYCAECHALGGRGGSETVEAPDLAGLHEEYGAPLPAGLLLALMLPPVLPVGTTRCGEHVLPRTGHLPFSRAARRGTILEILWFLERRQRRAHAQAP